MDQRAVPRDYRPLYKAALEQGWTVDYVSKRNSHLRWTNPEGMDVFTPRTPSTNGTGLVRIISKLRRAGLVY